MSRGVGHGVDFRGSSRWPVMAMTRATAVLFDAAVMLHTRDIHQRLNLIPSRHPGQRLGQHLVVGRNTTPFSDTRVKINRRERTTRVLEQACCDCRINLVLWNWSNKDSQSPPPNEA